MGALIGIDGGGGGSNGREREGRHRAADDWEIVYDGQFAFIGKVEEDNTALGYVVLAPVFIYLSKTNATRDQTGNWHFSPNDRQAWPIEMLGNTGRRTIRWTQRQRLVDFDEPQRKVFDRVVEEAEDLRKKVVLAEHHISPATRMPDLPPPGGK